MNIDFLKKIGHMVLDRPMDWYLDKRSMSRIKKHLDSLEERKKTLPIKVAYVVQMPEVWDKQQPVYEAMAKDERFDVSFIIVPKYDFQNNKIGEYGRERKFFHKKYPDAKFLLAINKSGELINIAKYKFDYIFYERPYDIYLPDTLKASKVCRISKVCYVPYVTHDSADKGRIFNRDFYRHVYMGFTNSEIFCRNLKKSFSEKNLKYHKFVNLGYPILDICRTLEDIPHDKKCIMWAPRWAFTKEIGGSHFLDYKDEMLDFALDNKSVDIVERPHPLMFPNIIKTGIMSENEVQNYKKKCEENCIKFDNNMMIEDSFKKTDILISDWSSILWLFFYTGKPIIYCPCDVELSEELDEIVKLMYIAESWEDVKRILDDLLNGNDYMKEQREHYLELQKNKYNDATGSILEFVYDDFTSQ
ncbi:MAG: CDP-glycerol glycerophosphotransferase family protein [Lachnospiraceae bacterium]|nr:CDP-glycerol glycerophosphotransferase family protein [Lachnospiraceae bacterium]